MQHDLVIVGAGPAGLAAAIYGQMAGLSTLVLERGRIPIDKACGEGILPPGVTALAEMGVFPPPEAQRPLVGIRFMDGELVAEGDFPAGMGKGIRRTALSAAMAERARQLGAELLDDCAVRQLETPRLSSVQVHTSRGTLSGRYLVAADGLHSGIRRQLGLSLPPPAQARYGVRRHYAVAPWSRYVEIHWHKGLEAYVTPVGKHEVGIAVLWQGKRASTFDELLTCFPRLLAKLGGAPPSSAPRGGGPFPQLARQRHAGHVVLLGDAAGYSDPITGEGVSLALRSARLLVDHIRRGESLPHFEKACDALGRGNRLTAASLLTLSNHPRLRRRVFRALNRDRDTFGRLLGVATGELEPASFGARRLLSLARGMLV